ncbi:hypothetical protein GQ600_16946 [Phytophthora cactorum]|nr:hypothetical protein GQ600_16946 [Phytophthora cactorum]
MSLNNYPLSGNSIVPVQLVSLNSLSTNIILDADSGNSSLTVQSGSTVSLYIDKYSNVGINTRNPGTQLEVASANGACLRLRYGTSTTAYANIFMTSTGDLAINPNTTNSMITTSASLNLTAHDGSAIGLKLGGVLVEASATQLNYTKVNAGTAAASKAIVLDSNSSVTGINSFSATTLKVGSSTLTGTQVDYLTNISPGAASINKALVLNSTGDISGINSISAINLTLNGIDVTLSISASGYVTGIAAGQASPNKALVVNTSKNITGVGNISLTSVTFGSSMITSTEADYISTITLGTAAASKALIVDATSNISGIASLTATTLTGTLQTASQPNITTLGNLTGVSVTSNTESTTKSNGSITTLGGIGVAKSINVGGDINVAGSASFSGSASLGDGTDSGSTTTGAVKIIGGVGITKSLVVGGSINVTDTTASTSTTTGALKVTGGVGIGGAANIGAALSVNDSTASTSTTTGALKVTGGVGIGGATNIGGALSVGALTATGTITLGSAITSGGVSILNTTASTTTGTGALIVGGGIGIGGNLNVAGTLTSGGSAYSASEWGTSGIQSRVLTATYTNSSSAASTTVTGPVAFNSIAAPTLAATNTGITTTNATTLYIGGAPASGTNNTITNAYSLYIASGRTYIGSTNASTSTSTGALTVSGGVGISGDLYANTLNTASGVSASNVNSLTCYATSLNSGYKNIIILGRDSVSYGIINYYYYSTVGSSYTSIGTNSYTPLVVCDNGYVGIGTSTPTYVLDISNPTLTMHRTKQFICGSISYCYSSINNSSYLQIYTSNNAGGIFISDNGYVGINNGSPAYMLDIGGNLNVAGTLTVNGQAIGGSGAASTYGLLVNRGQVAANLLTGSIITGDNVSESSTIGSGSTTTSVVLLVGNAS